ncbi:MAG TPA: ABC transporter ATP-binding protein [Polyangia bacterium]|nr:ABC transporter ATP-binding protein [Polyangia bacterium]
MIGLNRVSKIYRTGELEVPALRDVTLAVDAGQMVAVMGASGSGKSTLLNILGTLDRPTSGEYLLDGERVARMSDRELALFRNRKIGFVFQSFNLLPRYSALANVELPLIYAGISRRDRRRRAQAALERVGLADRMTHMPSQLSGGQQQRVSIARALVVEPVVLLADEPTGALDSETTVQIMELLADLNRSGMTIVVVTHEPGVAAYAGRVVRFRDGQIMSDESQIPHTAAAPFVRGAAS